MESSYLTVRLHSLSNGSPDKFLVNGSDFARSWVQLDLPNELIAQDHNDTWQNDPIQVVDHHGDSVTFRMIPTSAGAFSIGIAAYRPAPDAGCPTEGELRCFQPPVDRLTKEYVAAAQVSVQAAFAAPNPPAAPANLAASAGDGSVTLSWDDPQNPTISGYEYNVNHNDTNSGNLSGWSDWQSIAGSDADTTSHTLSGLANGREYRFHVRAVNAGGNGAGAPNAAPWYVSRHPRGAAARSSRRRLRRQRHPRGRISDRHLGAPDGATKYHATYTDDGGKSWHAPVDNHTNIPTNSLTFSVDNAKTYIIGVRAGNDAGWSGWRNSPSAGPYIPPNTPTPTNPPDAVSSVTVTRSDGSLTASWDAPDGATKYHVTYTDDGGKSWHAPVDDHTNIPTQQPHLQHRQRQDLRHRRPRRQRHRLERLAQLTARRAVSAAGSQPARHAVIGQRDARRRDADGAVNWTLAGPEGQSYLLEDREQLARAAAVMAGPVADAQEGRGSRPASAGKSGGRLNDEVGAAGDSEPGMSGRRPCLRRVPSAAPGCRQDRNGRRLLPKLANCSRIRGPDRA